MRGLHPQLLPVFQQLQSHLLGKEEVIKLSLCCLLADGHLLLEDVPGVGKTSLAKWLGLGCDLNFKRIQFTADLLPADITGLTVFEQRSESFRFHHGPIFHQLILADELNRASPRTQSALLEAMEERQVSIDGELYALPTPFFVIATQNPREQLGTFDLPESQLDRFAMRLSIGFPDKRSELAMLKQQKVNEGQVGLSVQHLLALQAQLEAVHSSDALLDYLLRLVQASRQGETHHPLSPRCSKILLKCAKAWALLHCRQHVEPRDVQAVFVAVCAHRLASGEQGKRLAQQILHEVTPYADLV